MFIFISCAWTLVIFVPHRIWWPISACGSFGRGVGSDWSSDGWLAHCPCSLSGSSALLCHHLFMSHLKCASQTVGESDQCGPAAVSSAELWGGWIKRPHTETPKLAPPPRVLCCFNRKFGRMDFKLTCKFWRMCKMMCWHFSITDIKLAFMLLHVYRFSFTSAEN